MVRSVNYFPYKGFILNSSYLINDSSSYQVHNNMYELFTLELDSIKPPGYKTTNGGWKEEDLSRDHLATDSIWPKLPPLSVQVSPSPVSREASRDFAALDVWLHTRYQVCKMVTYQVPGT